MDAIWRFVTDNQEVLSWLGGGAVVVAGGICAISKLTRPLTTYRRNQPVAATMGSVSEAARSMPEYFYRFRSTKALFGPYDESKGQFDELSREEIYFSHPSELNDPMEGFRNLLWYGDDIVWRNLLRHYLFCLMQSSCVFWCMGATFTPSACDHIIHQTPDDLPDAPVRKVYKEICDDFFLHQVPNDLIKDLAARTAAIGRDELSYYLRALNAFAVSLIQSAISRRAEGKDEMAPMPDGKRSLDSLGKFLKSGHKEVSEANFASSELTFMQSNLICDFGGERTAQQAGWMFLVRDFPTYYIGALERLVYPNWYAACFVSDPADPSMWGGYGDGHRGVCLKFSSSTNSEGSPPTLSLYRIQSWSGNKNDISANYAFVPQPIEKVRYTHEYPEINFFGSLGTVLMPKLSFWYAGPTGARSTSSNDIFENTDEWRKHYWNIFHTGSTSKTSEWAHEQEHRIIIRDTEMQKFSDKPSRKLKYKFGDLAGIIFGIKMEAADKIRIMKIIQQKCLSAARTDFEFYQAHYSRQSQKVEFAPLPLLKGIL
jgi:hypothetical protein